VNRLSRALIAGCLVCTWSISIAQCVSELAREFQTQHLPAIAALAREMSVDFKVVDLSEQGPLEIGITPLVVLQNFRGRYATIDRIRNFVRTSRVMPQRKDPLK